MNNSKDDYNDALLRRAREFRGVDAAHLAQEHRRAMKAARVRVSLLLGVVIAALAVALVGWWFA